MELRLASACCVSDPRMRPARLVRMSFAWGLPIARFFKKGLNLFRHGRCPAVAAPSSLGTARSLFAPPPITSPSVFNVRVGWLVDPLLPVACNRPWGCCCDGLKCQAKLTKSQQVKLTKLKNLLHSLHAHQKRATKNPPLGRVQGVIEC